jgi:O-antigen/teichoic acid export membrane protein
LAIFSEKILYVWTGDHELSSQVGPIVRLYSLGNGIMAASAFPFYLQYSKGDLSLHLKGNAAFVIILIPSIIWAAQNYGAIGAGYIWIAINALSFLIWLPYVHSKFDKNLNFSWHFTDVLIITMPMLCAALLINNLFNFELGSIIWLSLYLFSSLVIVFSIGLMCSTTFVEYVKTKFIKI